MRAQSSGIIENIRLVSISSFFFTSQLRDRKDFETFGQISKSNEIRLCRQPSSTLLQDIQNLKIAFGFHVLAEFVLSVLLFENAVNL